MKKLLLIATLITTALHGSAQTAQTLRTDLAEKCTDSNTSIQQAFISKKTSHFCDLDTTKTDYESINVFNIFKVPTVIIENSDQKRLKNIFRQSILIDIRFLQKLLFLIMLMITTIGNAMQTVQLPKGSLSKTIDNNSITYELKKKNKKDRSISIYQYDSEMQKYSWTEILYYTYKKKHGKICIIRPSSAAKKEFKKIKKAFNNANFLSS